MLFDVGDVVRASAIFLLDPLDPVSFEDPTTVTVVIEPPGAGGVTYLYPDAHIVRDSKGHYHTDFTVTTGHRWRVTWTATGLVIASTETNFLVAP